MSFKTVVSYITLRVNIYTEMKPTMKPVINLTEARKVENKQTSFKSNLFLR